MKLQQLLESDELTPRQAFLEFQQRLIDLDDGFEQADPVMTTIMRGVSQFKFIRPEKNKKHEARCIVLKVYDEDIDVDYRIAVYKSTRLTKYSTALFSKTCQTLDEVFIYLDRVLNANV